MNTTCYSLSIGMFLFYLLLSISMLNISYGFIPRNWVSLQTIISSEAVVSTLVERINQEILSDNVSLVHDMLNKVFMKTHTSSGSMNLDYLYLFVLVSTLSSSPSTLLLVPDSRWHSISMFSTIKKRTNVCILVLMIIFNRNIENAI